MVNEGLSIGLRSLFVTENHPAVSDGPAFGRRQEKHPANTAPARDEIVAPCHSAVFGPHQSSVIDDRFSGAFTRGEGRRPAVGGIEELRAVSGAARGAELIPGQAAVARMQCEEESAIAVEH